MHDINKFEATHRARLNEIFLSVKCPEHTDTNWCGAQAGQPCRHMGIPFGTLAAQTPRSPHQSRKLLAIDTFLANAGVGQPAKIVSITEGEKQTTIFDAEPAAWEK